MHVSRETRIASLRKRGGLLLGLAALALVTPHSTAQAAQYALIDTIAVPGNPLANVASYDISYDDPTTGRLYVSDRANAGVDIFDTHTDTFLSRLGGFKGLPTMGLPNGGPNGVTLIPAAVNGTTSD